MSTDYYPHTDGEKLAFLTNFVTQITPSTGALPTAVGLTAADVTAITTAKTNLATAQADKVAKKTAAQAAVANAHAVDRVTQDALRAVVRRVKAAPGYTLAIGKQLGVEPDPPAITPGAQAVVRPDLTEVAALYGEVTISFIKHGHTGVEIKCKRAGDATFSFLARDTESPYVDTRPNLTTGPETRQYTAQFLEKDTLVGIPSDVLVVTVPGAG